MLKTFVRFRLSFACSLVLVTIVAAPGVGQTRTLNKDQLDRLRAAQPASVALQIVGGNQTTTVQPDAQHVTLAAGQYVKATAPSQVRELAGRKRYVLPFRFMGFDRNASHVVRLAPVLEVEQKAMRLGPDGQTFQATVLVGLDDEASGQSRNLSPVVIQIWADRCQADRPDISIANTGQPYQRVMLTSDAPGESVDVTLLFQREKLHRWIDVERPSFRLNGVPERLPGLGIGSAEVNIGLGEGARGGARIVTVQFSPGGADPNQLSISPDQPGSVRIRTAGLKRPAMLTVMGPGMMDAHQSVDLYFPFAFFLATIIGGGVGALLIRLVQANRSASILTRHFAAGVLVGILGAGLYLLGVNVTEAPIPLMNNELAVFVIAALAAIGGVQGLTRLSPGAKATLEAGQS